MRKIKRKYTPPPKKLVFFAIWHSLGNKDVPGVFTNEYGGNPMLFKTRAKARLGWGLGHPYIDGGRVVKFEIRTS